MYKKIHKRIYDLILSHNIKDKKRYKPIKGLWVFAPIDYKHPNSIKIDKEYKYGNAYFYEEKILSIPCRFIFYSTGYEFSFDGIDIQEVKFKMVNPQLERPSRVFIVHGQLNGIEFNLTK
jgi:hypothetical protein